MMVRESARFSRIAHALGGVDRETAAFHRPRQARQERLVVIDDQQRGILARRYAWMPVLDCHGRNSRFLLHLPAI